MRQLLKHPAFTGTAILTLALGIGANAAIFTVVEAVLLAPLPYRDASRIAAIDTRWTDTGHVTQRVTGPDASDLRHQSRNFEAVSLYSGGHLGVQLRDHSVFTEVSFIDADFARVFDVHPVAGRLFADTDAHHAALVSEQFARDNFGSAQSALGQTLHVEDEAVVIGGVLPAWFDFPNRTQVWEASPLRPESESRTAFNYKAVARIRPGVSFRSVQTELDGISFRLQNAYPGDNRNKQIMAMPLQQALTGEARPTLLLLWATVTLILLIACVNVTHLQLVRSTERQRELAIRRALGSSRWQVMQPVLLESMLVSVLGGAAGILLAIPVLRFLVAMAPSELPRSADIHLNGWVLAFTLALSMFAAIVSSFLPARKAARVDPAEALKYDATRGMIRPGAAMLRNGLIVAEIAATFVLAMGAALLLRTMGTLMARDTGYQIRQMLLVESDAPAHSLQDGERVTRQYDVLFARLAALPGVEHVAGIMGLPTSSYGSNGYYETRGGLPVDPVHKPWSNFSVASPGYFETLGIPLKQGRDFTAQDTYGSPFVAVISEALARQSFGNTDPVGKQIQCGLDSDKWMTIIGVVGDVRQESPAEKPGPALYMPMAQHPFYANQIHIALRTQVAPLSLMKTVRDTIAQSNPQIAMSFTTMDALLSQSIAAERFRAVLTTSFAAAGLLLAMLGVYGTMAYSVAQRTFEIGVRMAFGANRSAILGSILRHTALLACWGIALGLFFALSSARLIASMLVGVGALDPVSLSTAALLLVVTALAAALGPGWRATHVDATVALRGE
jgi:predicted permease